MGIILDGIMGGGIFPGFDRVNAKAFLFGSNNTIGYIDLNNNFVQVNSPLPTDTVFIDGSFSGPSFGYAVSQNGEVLSSDDDGKSWTQRTTVTGLTGSYDIRAIEAVTDDEIVVGGLNNTTTMTVWKSSDNGDSWVVATTGVNNTPIESFSFLNSSDGYACTITRILSTSDGGDSWIEVDYHPGYFMDEISMLNANTGYFAAEDPFNNVAYKTVNGGLNLLDITTSGETQGVHAINTTDAFLCGEGGYVYETTNGTNWTATVVGSGSTDYKCVHFNSSTSLGAVCGSDGQIYITDDIGSSWTQINNAPPGVTFHSVHVFE